MANEPSDDLTMTVRDLSDAQLRAKYLNTSGEVGDPVAEALLAEVARRELDI